MAPLSKVLGGVLLEHKHFGADLDVKGNTIDPKLELKNFEHAGKILSEILSGMVIDGYPVIAEYIGDKAPDIVKDTSEKWRSSYGRSSQYLLQIVKYNKITCCTPFRSGYKNVVKDRFLPPPYSMSQSLDNGYTVSIVASNICQKWRDPNICSAEICSTNPILCIQSSC